jgi:hypothetical protein
MSFWGRIFGTEKALESGLRTVEKATDGVIAGIDAAFYTKEEKAADNIRLTKFRMDMVKSLQDECTPRALTRRVLAIIILGHVFLHLDAAIVCFILRMNGAVDFILKLVEAEMTLASIVAFFYFGYYGVKKAFSK